jgi:hypothetical protein
MHRGTNENGANQQWLPIEYKPTSNIKTAKTSMIDRIAWWPQTLAKRVEVKIEIADSAGNVTTENGFVSLPNIARHRSIHWQINRSPRMSFVKTGFAE